MMRVCRGQLSPDLMLEFPSRTAVRTFGEWVPNHVGLEQVVGLAGFLAPDFYEVEGHLFWDRDVAERFLTSPIASPAGNDPSSVERYYNTINLAEFFLLAADEAVHSESLVRAFGDVLVHFWGLALQVRFPERRYCLEVVRDVFGEDGACFTFWRDRVKQVVQD